MSNIANLSPDIGAAMPAEIKQEDGLTLTIIPCPSGRTGCIVVRLSGTDLHAEITSEWISAADNQHLLDGFFTTIAQLEEGDSKDWLSESEDFAISACLDPAFPGFVFLRIYLGSTSDDGCDWQINASLLVLPSQVELFAKDLSAL
ncbi:DUF6228 family protein [Pseudomonas sp. TH32]|uniref:DUF6228 family protein n=1 Tax=Pseudomonas sp. TH32 TaxID=2796397 RepID=UPI001F5BADDB|nr:DUF6228 family protein [Pseudomonas sp. TH32]